MKSVCWLDDGGQFIGTTLSLSLLYPVWTFCSYLMEYRNSGIDRRCARQHYVGFLHFMKMFDFRVKCCPRNHLSLRMAEYDVRWSSVNTLITCQQQSFDFSMKTERHLLAIRFMYVLLVALSATEWKIYIVKDYQD